MSSLIHAPFITADTVLEEQRECTEPVTIGIYHQIRLRANASHVMAIALMKL